MGSYSLQIIRSSVQNIPFPHEISSVAVKVQFPSAVSRPPAATKKFSLDKGWSCNSHRKLASKTVVALNDHVDLKRATARGFVTFTASRNLDPCGAGAEQSGMVTHGIQSAEELREELDALQKECEDVRARANSARARFMRLTDVVEQLRARAAKDVQIGNEASARCLLHEKQRVMKALENSKNRAQLLEELSIKLNLAISKKETQLITALSCAQLDLTNQEPDNMNVHVISPKASGTSDKEVSFQENDIISTNFVAGPTLKTRTESEPIRMNPNLPRLGVQDESEILSLGEAVVEETEDGKGQQTKSFLEDQPEDLMANGTDMVDLLRMSPEKDLRIGGTEGNEHGSCNKSSDPDSDSVSSPANEGMPFVAAPITSHTRTEDPSPISALQCAATATVSVNDSEYAGSQTSFESVPVTEGNASNVSTNSVSDLFVESTEEITKASRMVDYNGVPFEAYMENLNEVLENVELQLQTFLEVGREQDLIPERSDRVESMRELLELVQNMRTRILLVL